MNFYATKEAKADGYVVTDIKVTHFGEDYAKVEVHYQNGEIFEHEVNISLAQAIADFRDNSRKRSK